jgi:CDP-glycerol glycerophosphotransferase (TagB/SpsB family)
VVQVFHGMSDKPFTYERDFRGYDLCLCAGQRQADRLLAHEHNRRVAWAKVGYPKFDAMAAAVASPSAAGGRAAIIYCPTWRKGGISSIERFLDHPEVVAELARHHDLIVKPHPNILNPARPFYDASVVERLQRLERLPGVTLVRSGNVMPWQARAALFVGDVSAAGYEWLYFDRPMVFLNPRPGELRPSPDVRALTYLWQCGPVCDDVRDLPRTVDAALAEDRHRHLRETILHYSVHRPRDGGAVDRALAVLEERQALPTALAGAMADA